MGYEEENIKRYTTDQDLIEISGKHAYNTKLEANATIIVNGQYYEVKNTNFNNESGSGMQAMLLENLESKELIIAYQGTDMNDKKDIMTDIGLAGNVAPQQLLDAKQYYDQMTATYGKISYVCGNSLGGALANYVAVNTNDVKSVTYNPAILPNIDYKTEDYNNRIKNYLERYDALTLAQISAGFIERLPGKHIFTHISIPGFAFLIANHVGYLEGDQSKINMGEGRPPIFIEADDLLPFSIWTKEFLSSDSIGKGQKITINLQSLTTLQNSFEKMMLMLNQAKIYIDAASQIVESQGNQFSSRLDELQYQFDDVIKDTPLGLLIAAETYSKFNDIIYSLASPKFEIYTKVVQIINSIPLLSSISSMLSEVPLVNLAKGIVELLPTLDIVFESIGNLKIYAIPMLFKGLDNFFDDGVVQQLNEHYVHIISNENILIKRMENFKDQVGVVQENMKEADMALAKGGKIVTKSVPQTIKDEVDPCKVLTHNMSLKNMQLENNYQEFASMFQKNMEAALSNLYHLVESICNGLEDLILLWQAASEGLWIQLIPDFSTFKIWLPRILQNKKNMEQLLTEFDEELNSKRDILALLSGIKSIVKAAKEELNNIVEGVKPYVKNALFSNSEYSYVIAYNLASMNIYDTLNLVYQDIYYQLSENEAESIQILEQSAGAIEKSMTIVSEQIETGTIGI